VAADDETRVTVAVADPGHRLVQIGEVLGQVEAEVGCLVGQQRTAVLAQVEA